MEDVVEESGGPSLADLGITAGASTQKTAIGKTKVYDKLTLWEKLFLFSSLVSFATVLGLTIQRLTVLQPSSPDFTFALVLLLNIAFCLYYAFNGVFREREFELYAFIAASVIVLFYVIIEFIIHPKQRSGYKIARLVVICVLAPIDIGLCWKSAQEFGWLEFNIVGATEVLQTAYRTVCRLSALLNFDLQLQFSLLILIVSNFTQLSTLEKVVIGLGVAIAVIMFILGYIAVQIESVIMVIIFIILSVCEPGYIVYKFAKTIVFLTYRVVPKEGSALILDISIFVVGTIALIVRLVLIFVMNQAYRNFGKGLKDKSFGCCTTDTSLARTKNRH
ncbi:hypothetical protein TrispH2_006148 [Trichoplax sp. H2]|uniref:DUF7789 domain-containing protein n=1 Tax=Trichoplax adhaerens TaxID=10228 RepID=B3RWQ2_TRIAD|nr:hypothetical protein TRIADDRAFT_56837 [Trichoplax adhaerens]EDV24736.1 hypothetical protein TRIADDRAFT_56837 [Trichoplax adhaerens]RDD41694.1 hypothetical protein TrispH2_006148 [Trichoplax sp. H2]|eukprot:XP_002112626.1 hypothetical protein TRIADDRAFT_56837 [Trichoplax adhaerens]